MIPSNVFRATGTDTTAACSPTRSAFSRTGWKLLPHEWLGGAFLLSLWLRVVGAEGVFARDALLAFAAHGAYLAVLLLTARHDTETRWRVRLALFPVLMNPLYFLLASAVPAVQPVRADGLLQAADTWLIGTNLSLRLEAWIHPVATEVLSFCYLWYLWFLFSTQVKCLRGDVAVLKRQYAGLFSIYAIGYAGYSILPAVGPYIAMADAFTHPLEGWWFTDLTAQIVLAGSNRVDIFPSLHVANSLYILLFDYRYRRRRFWLCLAPCAGLVVSTIYLRYHYFVDVLFGLGLAWWALWLAQRVESRGKA
jgi:membrane-associated phospholipid phosphatase